MGLLMLNLIHKNNLIGFILLIVCWEKLTPCMFNKFLYEGNWFNREN